VLIHPKIFWSASFLTNPYTNVNSIPGVGIVAPSANSGIETRWIGSTG
jgi:hypothetical protein